MTGLRPHLLNEQGSDDNFSDDESSPLTHDIYGGSTRTVQETKGWDVFRDLPPKSDSGSMESQVCLEFTVKILKVIAYLVTFVIVLGCGVIAKGSVFFMTSQLRPDRVVPYCNKDLGRDKQFVVNLPPEERVAWTWCLLFAFMVPEVGTLLRSLRICFFKSWRKPPFGDFLFVFIMETLHTVGLAMLIFVILPELDAIKGAMLTNCVCFVPAVLSLLSRNTKGCTSRSEKTEVYMKAIVDIVAIAAQATGFVMWPLLEGGQHPNLWIIPISLACISCGWWENFIGKNSVVVFTKPFWRIKDRLKRTRYFTYIFISIWKILSFFFLTVVAVAYRGESISKFFSSFSAGFSAHKIRITEIKPVFGGTSLPDLADVTPTGEVIDIEAQYNTALYVLLMHIISAYLCYIFGKFACKIVIQGFSYAFPVNLTIPVTLSLLIAMCGLRHDDPCFFHNTIPDYLFFESPPVYFLNDFISKQHAWVWLLWLLSQTWITLHIWTPKIERLASTEKLFVLPMYNSLLIDQSLGLNRRKDDGNDVKTEELADREKDPDEYYETISVHTDNSSTTPRTVKKSDSITRIYACATMWHETRDEMMEMLKSIMRLDEDQCARRVAQKYLRVVDPDYYEFETHLFFDDAFEISDVNDDWSQVNRFVKLLVSTIDDAASHVHETNIRIRAPTKYPTPYGGRLVWTLPGKTKMICHLKDKSKIRHRKRWSQVMYMYYLLGHRLMELPISVERKEVIAENTYLLTLDGDIDFQPHAVRLLIDLMKKNRNLGAACGRIHPVGSGLMVWYQMFEYAIGHWLQKATEHMIGCVLCSPGCFSLFRGKALMDDNVMRRYTTQSDQARHYVQYDQGEDRWLCTLLLQRGYRVEYSAASDAYTHCPEGFNEFFNQRRRWVPSTMANIMDLLMDYKKTIKINDNISLPYISYQVMLMGGTILGPGTIFLMLVGAFVAAFRIDNWTSFYYNIVPIMFFMLVCFTCKSNIQLLVAQILSTAYALIMMAVFVGTALQLGEDGAGSPSAIFLSCMMGSFIIAAILHPQEFKCILPILIYFLSIPAMYLLLILYSIINLNVVTWGTREVQVKKTKKELEEEKKEMEEAKRRAKRKTLLGFLQDNSNPTDDKEEEGSFELSFAGLFKCMFCTYPKPVDEKQQLLRIAESLDTLGKRLESIEKVVDPHGHVVVSRRRTTSASSRDHSHGHGHGHGHGMGALAEDPAEEDQLHDDESDTGSTGSTGEPKIERNDEINPYWIEDKDLKKGPVAFLSAGENQFWKELLEKYLFPIDEDKNEKARIAADLIELRNSSVFGFFMINALFVMIVFLLQLNKDSLHVKWPFGVKTNITYDETTQEVLISKEYLQLEPIGLVFVFFFALILVIQFTAMLFHRFGTISHILASTELNWCCNKKVEEMSNDKLLDKQAVDIVRHLQRLKGINGDYENDSGSSADRVGRRRTIYNIEKQRQKTRTIGTLDVAFRKRFLQMKMEEGEENPGTPILGRKLTMRREVREALEVRRRSLQNERRKSQMQTLGANNAVTRTQRISNAGVSVKDLFEGHPNPAYEPDDDQGSLMMQNVKRNWAELERANSHM
ncbi:chitin synthase chs-2-like isoform X1 [Macrosteles quadrilineatus]|uniref:chitin synthase chs-2-like isoform X1 n=1 Tax=Macrosteles quadrilineatus TaxID=74068 RepID=UPI0023E2FC87|nr:chitin synthase chs-2-like isoform X1 [Macrosteles quadrilineatus]